MGTVTLPDTGASAQQIEDMTPTATPSPTSDAPPLPPCASKWKVEFYHWEAGEWTMKLRCPKSGTVTPEVGL